MLIQQLRLNMKNKINYKNRGFTMIEMLVSVAIFAIVITMVMGTIVTIVDASRKARTMTEVMNNLNFSFESMTRTLKTAQSIDSIGTGGSTITATDQRGRPIVYSFSDKGITKSVDGGANDPITSADVKLISWKIEEFKSGSGCTDLLEGGGCQPRVFFSVKGRVETAKGIYSEFNLQSTVSQRQLKLSSDNI